MIALSINDLHTMNFLNIYAYQKHRVTRPKTTANSFPHGVVKQTCNPGFLPSIQASRGPTGRESSLTVARYDNSEYYMYHEPQNLDRGTCLALERLSRHSN